MFPLCSLRKAAHKADEEEDVEMKDLLSASGLSLRTRHLLKAKMAKQKLVAGFRVWG